MHSSRYQFIGSSLFLDFQFSSESIVCNLKGLIERIMIVTFFDELVFEVEINMMPIYQLTITLSTLLELIVLFDFHPLQHFRSTIRHLNHQILSDLSASRKAEKSLLIGARFLISFHVFRKY